MIQQEAQQQIVYGRHEALSEEEDAVVQADERMAGDQRSAPAPSLRKVTIDREEGDPEEDGAGFQYPGGDEAQRERSFCFLRTGNRTTAVPMPARATMISRTPPTMAPCPGQRRDVVRALDGAVESEGGNRDKCEQIEDARR